MTSAAQLIEQLELQPHPEGGWYRETWRAPAMDGERAAATAIYFLLEAQQRSHWHRVDAAEIWLWHAGDPLEISLAETDAGPVTTKRLGRESEAGARYQIVIEEDHWQAARSIGGANGYTLVSCIVAPGFEFEGFELASPNWQPG